MAGVVELKYPSNEDRLLARINDYELRIEELELLLGELSRLVGTIDARVVALEGP